MSHFKKGDRVKVEFEGVIQDVDTHAKTLRALVDGCFIWVELRHLTKLHDPLPTKAGTVIRLDNDERVITVLVLQGSGSWFGAGTNHEFSNKRVQELADEHGFTVLYVGDDE
jgi:hypothetical protein